nr:MAG TPA: hypothetical protein [Caudoviricetes sp.]
MGKYRTKYCNAAHCLYKILLCRHKYTLGIRSSANRKSS